ncbi:MAG TPA: phosphate ABC transporter permease subunit PstC [Actinomycetota bacterium]|jgi:phosphate transport system permease protein|nr:phosphate ABC transporter permease subunit PstC [Actinomycetota bacterium]
MATVAETTTLTLGALRGSVRRRRKENLVRGVFFGSALLSIAISVGIVLALIGGTVDFLSNVQLSSLWSGSWRPRQSEFDIPTIFLGSLMVTAVAMLVAVPLGLGAAMFLSEYAGPRLRRSLKPILETLAGIPSVVIGFFALTVINPAIVQGFFGSTSTFTIMAAGLGVGILTIPLVASVAEDAMYAVPGALREAAYGIGARRRTVSTRVVFPAAVSGIVAAAILGVSRALGETMVVAIAAGGTGSATRSFNPLEPGQTMTAAISSLAIGSDSVRTAGSGLNAFDALYFVGILLFVFTFALNLISERFVRRVRKVY